MPLLTKLFTAFLMIPYAFDSAKSHAINGSE